MQGRVRHEKNLDTSGFVEKRKRARHNGLNEVRQVHRVMGGLLGDARQERAFLLGLDYAGGFAIDEQKIIAGSGFQRRFAQRDAASGGGIELLVILNDPATRNELRVNFLAGELFGGERQVSLQRTQPLALAHHGIVVINSKRLSLFLATNTPGIVRF